MNVRQNKKRFKKAVDILNEIEIVDYDCDSESIIYLNIEDSEENKDSIKEHCAVLGINKQEFLNDITPIKEFNDLDLLDLSMGWIHWQTPKKYDIYYSKKTGFVLKKCFE